jgi:hypothetical protein
VILPIGDIDGGWTVRRCPLSELNGRHEAHGTGTRGETTG